MRVHFVQILALFSSFYAGFGSPNCKNGGTKLADGSCICPSQFYGPYCGKITCENDGRPVIPINDDLLSFCICNNEFTGQFCQLKCLNGHYDVQFLKCDCEYNYYGEKCDKYCLYGSIDRENNECVCDTTYFGEKCDKTCINGYLILNPYTQDCECDNDYYGETCDSYCKNGWWVDNVCECYPEARGKSCDNCANQRFSGENCDKPVCEHGYPSSENICICYHGYTGQFCHLDSQAGVHYNYNCIHGKWSSLEEKCICDAGWGGIICTGEPEPDDMETSYVTASVLIGLCVLLPLSVIGYLFRKAFLQSRAGVIETDREELLESAQIFTTSVNIPSTPPPTYEAGLEAPRPSTVFPDTPPPSYEEATHPPMLPLDRL